MIDKEKSVSGLNAEERAKVFTMQNYQFKKIAFNPEGYFDLYHYHSLWILMYESSKDSVISRKQGQLAIPQGTLVGMIDFFPNHQVYSNPRNRTHSLYKGIDGLNKFFTYIARLEQTGREKFIPQYLFGDTNPEMAYFAVQRLGFDFALDSDENKQLHRFYQIGVIGETKTVKERFEALKQKNFSSPESYLKLKNRARRERLRKA